VGKGLSVDRVLKGLVVAGASSVVLLGALLVSGATGARAARPGVVADSPPAALHLPLPGEPGFPPKLDGPAVASKEILPNLQGEFPGVPTTPDAAGYPPVRQLTFGGRVHYLLLFNTGFENSGPGPVLVWGHRASTKTRDMMADQYIKLKGGSYALRRNVGALRFIFPTGLGLPHLHWHYLGAELYALYPAGHFGQSRRSAKQGFCMSEPASVFTDYCGYKRTRELTQIEAMYPHTADFYNALVEGQYIDITGLPAGKYTLMNWMNSQCLLKETTYADNAGTTAVTLTYPNGLGGMPAAAPGTEQNAVPHLPCPAPQMTAAQAARYLQQAVVKKSGGPVTGLRSRCARVSTTGFNCQPSWRRDGVAYSGRMTISHVASSTLGRYATALSGISAQALFQGSASGRQLRWSINQHLLPNVRPAHP
jgi:Lysyl oxidase